MNRSTRLSIILYLFGKRLRTRLREDRENIYFKYDDPILSSDSGDEDTSDVHPPSSGQDKESSTSSATSPKKPAAGTSAGGKSAKDRRASSSAEDALGIFSTILVKYPIQSLVFICVVAGILAAGFSVSCKSFAAFRDSPTPLFSISLPLGLYSISTRQF